MYCVLAGNMYVTAAKALVSSAGRCSIDLLAGPSELLVVADRTADPSVVAADLLAQVSDIMASYRNSVHSIAVFLFGHDNISSQGCRAHTYQPCELIWHVGVDRALQLVLLAVWPLG